MYIDKVDDIVTEYNSTYHNTIKMMPIDAKASSCIDYKDPKIEVVDYVRTSK